MINNLHDLGEMLSAEGDTEDELKARIKRNVYKYTDCGAWIEFEPDGIKLGSIVEGCDAFGTAIYPLKYPFSEDDYRQRENAVEREADALWEWANRVRDDGQTDADHGLDAPDIHVEFAHLNPQGRSA